MRRLLYNAYNHLKNWIAPGLRNSQFAYLDKLSQSIEPDTAWLDLGCGHNLFPMWMETALAEERRLIAKAKYVAGIDADFDNLKLHQSIDKRVFGNVEQLPFKDESFDLITANMVMEHIANPPVLLTEVLRVLKPGGMFLFHTPNYWGYTTLSSAFLPDFLKVVLAKWLQARESQDVFPTHYRLNTRNAVQSYAKTLNFLVDEIALVESSAQTVMMGPVVAVELLWIRLLRLQSMAGLRTNLVVRLRKPWKSLEAGPSARDSKHFSEPVGRSRA